MNLLPGFPMLSLELFTCLHFTSSGADGMDIGSG